MYLSYIFRKMYNKLLNCIIPILKVFSGFETSKGETLFTILLAEIPKGQIFLSSSKALSKFKGIHFTPHMKLYCVVQIGTKCERLTPK